MKKPRQSVPALTVRRGRAREKSTGPDGPKDGAKVDQMLYAGSSLDKAREAFAAAIYHRPRIRLTIRQRTRVLEQWRHFESGGCCALERLSVIYEDYAQSTFGRGQKS
jgi:hypothetical protein